MNQYRKFRHTRHQIYSSDQKKENQLIKILSQIILPLALVSLTALTLYLNHNDSENNLEAKYFELFYKDITSEDSTRMKYGIDILKLMNKPLGEKMAQWLLETDKKLTAAELVRLNEIINNTQQKAKNIESEYNNLKNNNTITENEFKKKTKKIQKYLDEEISGRINDVEVDTVNYKTKRLAPLGKDGKIFKMGDKILGVNVLYNNYRYTLKTININPSLTTDYNINFSIHYLIIENKNRMINDSKSDSIKIILRNVSNNSEKTCTDKMTVNTDTLAMFKISLEDYKGDYQILFSTKFGQFGEAKFSVQ